MDQLGGDRAAKFSKFALQKTDVKVSLIEGKIDHLHKLSTDADCQDIVTSFKKLDGKQQNKVIQYLENKVLEGTSPYFSGKTEASTILTNLKAELQKIMQSSQPMLFNPPNYQNKGTPQPDKEAVTTSRSSSFSSGSDVESVSRSSSFSAQDYEETVAQSSSSSSNVHVKSKSDQTENFRKVYKYIEEKTLNKLSNISDADKAHMRNALKDVAKKLSSSDYKTFFSNPQNVKTSTKDKNKSYVVLHTNPANKYRIILVKLQTKKSDEYRVMVQHITADKAARRAFPLVEISTQKELKTFLENIKILNTSISTSLFPKVYAELVSLNKVTTKNRYSEIFVRKVTTSSNGFEVGFSGDGIVTPDNREGHFKLLDTKISLLNKNNTKFMYFGSIGTVSKSIVDFARISTTDDPKLPKVEIYLNQDATLQGFVEKFKDIFTGKNIKLINNLAVDIQLINQEMIKHGYALKFINSNNKNQESFIITNKNLPFNQLTEDNFICFDNRASTNSEPRGPKLARQIAAHLESAALGSFFNTPASKLESMDALVLSKYIQDEFVKSDTASSEDIIDILSSVANDDKNYSPTALIDFFITNIYKLIAKTDKKDQYNQCIRLLQQFLQSGLYAPKYKDFIKACIFDICPSELSTPLNAWLANQRP